MPYGGTVRHGIQLAAIHATPTKRKRTSVLKYSVQPEMNLITAAAAQQNEQRRPRRKMENPV